MASPTVVTPAAGALEVLVTPERDPAANLALEDALLLDVERGTRPDTLRLWVAEQCLVRGAHRSCRSGWHRESLARDLGLAVHTRSTGGGTVFFDRGNLNWSFYLRRVEGYVGGERLFRGCAAFIARCLGPLGIAAAFAPPNRIDAVGRKISGMASRASFGAVLVHGTLLVASDLERLDAVCIPPPGCPPVTRLADLVPGLTVAAVAERIAAGARTALRPPVPA
jgi:lipoate-protein ligase A